MARTLACAALVAAVLASLLAPPAGARARRCGKFSRPDVVLRVYKIRGVTCKAAVRAARIYAASVAPAPWKCELGFGPRYKGHKIYATCGHGGRGPLMRRPHAFVIVVLSQHG